ncbi:MAG: S8 family serine peptidase [Anaerolineae bacterium]
MRKKALPVFSLLLVVAMITAIMPMAFADPVERVMIEYMPGKGAMVRNSVMAAGGQVHHDLARINTLAVSVSDRWANRLAKDPNVVSIEADPLRYLAAEPTNPYEVQVMPWGIEAVQAPDVWAEGYTGEGVTVCIIDTGLYADHEDLWAPDRMAGYSQIPGEEWNTDGYGHGTHVAGTIGALDNEIGVIGVSYAVPSIFMVKIFDNAGEWVSKAHASDLIAAAYECKENGANIISMSLSGTTKSGKERMAFEDLYAEGILSVAAASNDGIEEYHYPASYDSVISVAAVAKVDDTYEAADFSQFNDQVELAAPGVNVLSTLSYRSTVNVTVNDAVYSAIHVEYAAYGTASGELVDGGLCTAGGDWAGKVVLCYRGEISFYDKVMNVQNSGGVAAVIYNNLDEPLNATLGEDNSSEILAVGLSQAQGLELVAAEGEIADVVSKVDSPASGYEAWGGTSMATPHVSGVAALLWSANPELTNVQIREAMDMTALDLGDPGRDVHYGYGLVQAYDALDYLIDLKPGKGPKGPKH